MKRFLIVVIAILLCFGIVGCGGGNSGKPEETAQVKSEEPEKEEAAEENKEAKSEEAPKQEEEPEQEETSEKAEEPEQEEAPAAKKYKDGKYLVGSDIEPGLYRVTLTDSIMKMGYIERSKDLKMEFDSILANILLTGNGYVEILADDVAVKLQGVSIEKINIEELEPDFKNELEDGIYLVGYDIKPGTYKIEVTDTVTNMGYVERSSSAAMNFEDIIANELIQGQSYVEVLETDFCVRLQGVKMTLNE